MPIDTNLMHPFFGPKLYERTLTIGAQHAARNISCRKHIRRIIQKLSDKTRTPFAIPRIIIIRILPVKISPIATRMHNYQAKVADNQFLPLIRCGILTSICSFKSLTLCDLRVQANITAPIILIVVAIIN